jgi:hypothetical protein
MDLSPFLTGGAATRSNSLSGMNPQFEGALASMFAAAPDEVRQALAIKSGYRSPQVQQQLWNAALAKYGSPEAARKWVAPPGNSEHNHGLAADLAFTSPFALQWAHQNAGQFGLAFPLSNENWHVELAGARGGGQPQQAPTPMPAPTPPQQAIVPQPGLTTGGEAPAPSSMLLGDIAMKFLSDQQARQQAQQQQQASDQARRAALFGGGLGSMYG